MVEPDAPQRVDTNPFPRQRPPSEQTRLSEISATADQVTKRTRNRKNTLLRVRDRLAHKWGVDPRDIRITSPTRKDKEHVQTEVARRELPLAQTRPEEHLVFERLLLADTVNGDEFAAIRRQLGASQGAIAALSGVDPFTIVRIEGNQAGSPRLLTRKALYHIFVAAYQARDNIALELGIDPADVPFRRIKERLTSTRNQRQEPKTTLDQENVKITPNMSIGQIIATIRGIRGLTQEVMAGLAGLSKSSVDKLETGRRNPSIRTIYRLCKVLQIPEGDPIQNLLIEKLNVIHLERASRSDRVVVFQS